MATLGNVPAEAYTNTVKDSFSGNGSTTAFTMSLPTVTNDVRVVVENVIQDPTVAYSVSGTTLTFTSAPPTGTNNVYVVHLGPAVMTTVPPAEIADATTFASSLTVQGAFTSKGIDDNADAVALTIDSSENVLISTTNVNPHQDGSGIALRESAGVIIGVDGTHAIIAARHNSDGEVIRIQKDNSTVGVIGTQGSRLSIGSGDVNLNFNASANSMYPISDPAAGTLSSGIVDLGAALATFKDAYLSGGVYLGGTAAANKLEDYEEGAWTPSLAFDVGGGGIVYGTRQGSYVKVGNLCHVQYILAIPSGLSSSDYFARLSLPFEGFALAQNMRQKQYNSSISDWALSSGGGSNPVFFASNTLTDYARGDDINGRTLAGSYTYRTTA